MPVDVSILKEHAQFVHTLTYLTTISQDYTIHFPALTNLSFEFLSWPTTFHDTVPPPDRNDYLASIIRLCPRIQNLTLTNAVHCPSVQLWETILSTLENPRRLAVTRMDPTDNPSMQAFWKACSRYLSELSFGRLQERHFATLSILDLNGCALFTSEMVLSVLSGCPLLEDLSAPYLTASDLRQSEPARRAWICFGLTRLKVYIARDREHPDADQLVFEQLSKLVQLEELDIGDDTLANDEGSGDKLDA
ncbi:hypothetical protein EC957_008968 [Mortierella hygrophila]|uniref:Uncharacterized protein n=1 Tax=Mortierella hygrophila TaxID=979708 RepID=A0A9P6EWJ6_9FUNG|nr:hypothetical protein EC957_008968 [Mortierella hygrophila]